MADEEGTIDGGLARIRDIGLDDLDWLLDLNNASVPHVNLLEREALADILQMSAYARCSLRDGEPVGALLALRPGQPYASRHYRWFERHHADFLYIDRVMVDGAARKGGHGRRLYADLDEFSRGEGGGHIACEVNSRPPNPISMSFHQALGFVPVGELANEDESKAVVLMMKAIAA